MAKRSKPRAPKFLPGIHTVQLPQLFTLLASADSWMSAVSQETFSFNGWMSFQDARAAAEFGNWNAPQIKALTLPQLTQASDDMRYWNDVTGEQLDIAAFCNGEPEYWENSEPIQKPCGRILRFAVEIGGLGDVAAHEMRARGEAIIALINSLELQGHSIEVTIVRAFKNTQEDSYKFLIPIKQAGQPLDTKRFQFMLGHPAFYRRCLFGLTELAQGHDMTRSGLGTFTQQYAPEGCIHIPHNVGLGTDEFAMKWAQEFALTFANQEQN